MSMQGPIGRAGGTKVKRTLGVQATLEWAFRVEMAQLELPVRRDIDQEGIGFCMEYVLIQRARLGFKVDGDGHKLQSYTHEDAGIVAATLPGRPDSLGGKRMAIYVAELARVGMTPNWMPGIVPRCAPVETKSNQHGERSTTRISTPRDGRECSGATRGKHCAGLSGFRGQRDLLSLWPEAACRERADSRSAGGAD